MPAARDLDPSLSPAHFFGAEVRRAREAAGMTLADLGARVPCDVSTVSRVESAILSPTARFAAVCDESFPQMNGWFTRFYNDSRTWEDNCPSWFRDWLIAERRASSLRVWQPLLIPGLLQTEDYTRALYVTCRRKYEEDIEERVRARIDRRKILDREDPPELRTLIYEPVLRRLIGTPKIMAEQVEFLIATGCRPDITIQIMPETSGAYVGLSGACWIAEVAGETDVAYLETTSQGFCVTAPALVREASIIFDDLRDEAMSRSLSLKLLGKVAEEWKSTLGAVGASPATVLRTVENVSR